MTNIPSDEQPQQPKRRGITAAQLEALATVREASSGSRLADTAAALGAIKLPTAAEVMRQALDQTLARVDADAYRSVAERTRELTSMSSLVEQVRQLTSALPQETAVTNLRNAIDAAGASHSATELARAWHAEPLPYVVPAYPPPAYTRRHLVDDLWDTPDDDEPAPDLLTLFARRLEACKWCAVYAGLVRNAKASKPDKTLQWTDVVAVAAGVAGLNARTLERRRKDHERETGHRWPDPADVRLLLYSMDILPDD